MLKLIVIISLLANCYFVFQLFARRFDITKPVSGFRIKHIKGIGYFAQAKKGNTWYKIGDHGVSGFGFYDEKSVHNPLDTEEAALERIEQFKKWSGLIETEPTYIAVT